KILGRYWQLPIVIMRAVEALVVFGAFRLACAAQRVPKVDPVGVSIQTWIFGSCILATMIGMGLFSRRMRDRMAGVVLRITLSVGVGAVVAGVLLAPWDGYRLGLASLVGSACVASLMLMITRTFGSAMIDRDVFKRRVLALGTGANAAHLLRLRRRADQ